MDRRQQSVFFLCLLAPLTLSPAAPKRIDLLYLDPQLLTYGDPVPPAAAPILADAAKQPTWTTARPPVALLTQEQADALLAAFSNVDGSTVCAAPAATLLTGSQATTSVRPPTTSPADAKHAHLRFDLAANAAPIDPQRNLPLRLHATASALLATADPRRPLTLAWSADVGVATPLEHTLLIDLGPPTLTPADGPRPAAIPTHALLLVRLTAQTPVPKEDPATHSVPGDLYRAYARTTPTCDRISAALRAKDFPEAINQVTYLRGQLYPLLTDAVPPDLAASTTSLASRLDALAAHLRDRRVDRATEAYATFLSEWRALHYRLARILALP